MFLTMQRWFWQSKSVSLYIIEIWVWLFGWYWSGNNYVVPILLHGMLQTSAEHDYAIPYWTNLVRYILLCYYVSILLCYFINLMLEFLILVHPSICIFHWIPIIGFCAIKFNLLDRLNNEAETITRGTVIGGFTIGGTELSLFQITFGTSRLSSIFNSYFGLSFIWVFQPWFSNFIRCEILHKLGLPKPIQFSCMVMRFMSSFEVVLGWIPGRQ
jgi:hypothetical protein